MAATEGADEEEGALVPPALPKLREEPDTAVAQAGASAFCFSGVLNPLTLMLAAGGHVPACPRADALLPEAAAAADDDDDDTAAVDSGRVVHNVPDSRVAGRQNCAGLSSKALGVTPSSSVGCWGADRWGGADGWGVSEAPMLLPASMACVGCAWDKSCRLESLLAPGLCFPPFDLLLLVALSMLSTLGLRCTELPGVNVVFKEGLRA